MPVQSHLESGIFLTDWVTFLLALLIWLRLRHSVTCFCSPGVSCLPFPVLPVVPRHMLTCSSLWLAPALTGPVFVFSAIHCTPGQSECGMYICIYSVICHFCCPTAVPTKIF